MIVDLRVQMHPGELWVSKQRVRGVSGGWAIAHQVFGRIEGAAKRWRGGSGAPHYYLPTQFR